jgi:steroid Delta-isomerase
VNVARHADPRVARVVVFFEALTPSDVKRISDFYRDDARFKDPFNDVHGVAAIEHVFAHMYVALNEPRFVVRDIVAEGSQCFLTWDFLFRFKRFSPTQEQCVRGGSHIVFDGNGRIALHRDYWDAAEELYEKLPLVGTLLRLLKQHGRP